MFTIRDMNQLSRAAKQNRKTSLQGITNAINEGREHTFCKKTISRKSKCLGYKRRVAKNKMVVKEGNRKKRVSWCRAKRNWTVDENWKKWIFGDESQVVVGTIVFKFGEKTMKSITHILCACLKEDGQCNGLDLCILLLNWNFVPCGRNNKCPEIHIYH